MAITYSMADAIVRAAIAHGRRQEVTTAAVVCDLAGNPIASARDELAGAINLDAARGKAATAVNFGATSGDLLAALKADSFLSDTVIATPSLSLLPGGAPILQDGVVIGGLGIAGGHYSQDQVIALQALADWARAADQAGRQAGEGASGADAPALSEFHGRKVVITGARGGIGLLACERFAQAVAKVIGLDREADEDGALAAAYQARGLDIAFEVVDVSQPDAIEAFGASLLKRLGYVDILVNNAGTLSFSPVLQTMVAEWERVQNINCRSAYLMMKAVVPLMGGQGVVLNMSSSAALAPTAYTAAYSIAKMGLITLSKIAALEMGPGVRVIAVCPGPLDTPMPHNYLRGHPKEQEIMAQMIDRTIVKRLGRPGEIADLLFFLASDRSGFITGTAISADGGFIS